MMAKASYGRSGESPRRSVRSNRKLAGCGLAWLLLAQSSTVLAQSPPVDVGALIGSARLGAGYAQMIGLATAPDIAAAHYNIEASESNPGIDVFRLPYQARWLTLAPGSDLYWKVAAGYFRLRDNLPFAPTPSATGVVESRWTAYSASAGVLAKIQIGQGFTFEPAVDMAIARLENDASYSGAATILPPLFDGLLFNWQTNAWIATPSLALAWEHALDEAKVHVRGHVARSWIGSFDESGSLPSFNEAVNVYSIRGDYAWPAGLDVAGRPLSWVAIAGFAGFFGANRDSLGFTSVTELGGGFELPTLSDDPRSQRVRLAARYLFGPNVHGWGVGLSLPF
jgi:hypothetical protein